jgi:hypothetical protein
LITGDKEQETYVNSGGQRKPKKKRGDRGQQPEKM